MRRGERVNASAEPGGREFGSDSRRELAGQSPVENRAAILAGAFLGSTTQSSVGFRFAPPTSPKASGSGGDAERKSPAEIFVAAARRPARPSGAAKPDIQSRLKVAATDQGPCLYLGPSGERCHRRALRDCYCAAHLPVQPSQLSATAASAGPTAEKPQQRTAKIVSVIAALVGFLAPLLENIIREFLRWLHSQ